MRFDLYIAHRLGLSGVPGARVSAGVRVGVAGIALAFIVMLLSIAIVSGFKQEIRRKVTGYESQLMIHGRGELPDADREKSVGQFGVIAFSPELCETTTSLLGPVNMAPLVDAPALLKTDSAFSALIIRGIDERYDRSFIRNCITEGAWDQPDSSASVVISAHTARALGLNAGQRVYAHFFRSGAIVTRRLTVAAVFDTHFEDYDSHYAFADISLTRSAAGLPDSLVTAVAVDGLGEGADTRRAAADLGAALLYRQAAAGADMTELPEVTDVTLTGAQYLNWLELLDTNVVVILVLMALVAGFTLISSLFIIILERVPMIGLLKALGATNGQIRGIFIWLAEKIVLRGLLIGNVVSLATYFIQHTFHLLPLDAEAYYLSYVPSQLSFSAWLLLNLATVAGSLAILVLPTHIITRMSPTESLRRYDGQDS